MNNLSGKHVLITGGGTGIGLAMAKAFSAAGAKVTLAGRNLDRVQAQAKNFPTAQGVAIDVTNPKSVEQGLQEAAVNFGTVEILINNAGAAESAPLSKTDAGLWGRMLDVNLTGVFNMTHAAFPAMKDKGYGRIINIASTAGLEGYAYTSAYCAAKHGVVGFTRALAEELKGGITINAVCPGFTRTEMVERAIKNIMDRTGFDRKAAEAEIEKLNAGGRLVEPEEVAIAALNLAAGDKTGEVVALRGEGPKP